MSVGGKAEILDTAVFSNAGYLTFASGGDFAKATTITNSGTIELSGGTLKTLAEIHNAGGTLKADAGTTLIVDTATIDVYRLTIPTSATYTFETSGWVGACSFALEDATAIGLFDAAGRFIADTAFIDPTHGNYCSRLTRTLTPGTYYVAVAGSFGGGVFGGRYRLQARLGN